MLSTTTTSLTLKKSFYHQAPLTFNYYIRPNWSAGAGLIWNKFYGAVADREVIKQNGQQVDTLSKGIIFFKSDSTSSFSKSYFQALIETEYKWKRFYFGARYTFGLQPYIKFSLPAGGEQKEKKQFTATIYPLRIMAIEKEINLFSKHFLQLLLFEF